ncbi:hypothetical protein JCM24511_03335 [Saitozyma sp. JCM 24511]|nr:hypothetical protein JCM24511_03335 [Saitozyma sp. JCM 24511]
MAHSSLRFLKPRATDRSPWSSTEDLIKTASEAVQLGLVGLLSRPVLKAIFPSEQDVSDSYDPTATKSIDAAQAQKPLSARSDTSTTPPETVIASPISSTPSSPTVRGPPIIVPAGSLPPLHPAAEEFHETGVAEQAPIKHEYVPDLYSPGKTYPIIMATAVTEAPTGSISNGHHDADLAKRADGLSLNGDRPASRASYRNVVPNGDHNMVESNQLKQDSIAGSDVRPSLSQRPSRSYVKPIPIVTTYEPELPDNASINKRQSVGAGGGSVRAPSVKRTSSKTGSARAPSVKGSVANGRPPSVTGSRAGHAGEGFVAGAVGGAAVGEVLSSDRQRDLQQGTDEESRPRSRLSLHDNGPVPREERAMSPRPRSAFGHRPEPRLVSVVEDQQEGVYDGRESRAGGMLGRSGTVVSRANTLGRNGTLSRSVNGGIVGSRKGAFGRGAGASIGTQPEEVLGRDDIHARAELSERILDDATLRRLSTMEKKDAKRLSKVIKGEGKAEARAVQGSIKELERISKLQREAAAAEVKSQKRLSKWTSKEHKARLRFLKEKERYERIEGELRNAENDYEERRDHAAGLTSQMAEKTQELDDLRAQKAADDREREVKLLALKNPGHS